MFNEVPNDLALYRGPLHMNAGSITAMSESRLSATAGIRTQQQILTRPEAHVGLQHYVQGDAYREGQAHFGAIFAGLHASKFPSDQAGGIPIQAPIAMLPEGHNTQQLVQLAQGGKHQTGTNNRITVDASNAWHEQLPIASTYGVSNRRAVISSIWLTYAFQDPQPSYTADAYQWHHVPSTYHAHRHGQRVNMGLDAGYDEQQYRGMSILPAVQPAGSNAVAPQAGYGQVTFAAPSHLPTQDMAPSLRSHRVVKANCNKKVRVEYGGSAGRHYVKVHAAIAFLESRGLIRSFATDPPQDGSRWLKSLKRWLNQVLNDHNNPDLHAVLFGRSCDGCEGRKVKCKRNIFTLKCWSCAKRGDHCQTLRPMKQRGRPTLEDVAARKAVQGPKNSAATKF
ncbi:hypothetical protein CERSUDRAFT_126021 [Gelatoporia subvermispora B]|uniref:Zn(2)-C6 fungal-type domain-containing protein n=1 Tax=Ceriporiopsis subvermispora (strain B) TaxID=914234 RepID=M2QA39_CERS8|nr:hypothetical protein CERSUDRAFT_126021 [Gelatoporia subvermispora B]